MSEKYVCEVCGSEDIIKYSLNFCHCNNCDAATACVILSEQEEKQTEAEFIAEWNLLIK
jgi:ribosomal protein L37AE/L43A